jgi:hypothetical protein
MSGYIFPDAKNTGEKVSSTEWNGAMRALAAGPANLAHYRDVDITGTADSTAGIAEAYAKTAGRIYLPPNCAVRYNGPGLDMGQYQTFCIGGEDAGAGTILLGGNSRLVQTAALNARGTIRGLDVQGGKGLYYQSFTGSNVYQTIRFEGLRLYNYTEAAIATEAIDSPYFRLDDVEMQGANTTTSMGFALGGYGDQTKMENCKLLKNRVGVKFRRPVNTHLDNCDFLQFSTDRSNGPCVGIWAVPAASLVGYGNGVPGHGSTWKECKFGAEGAENWVAGDHRILFADEGAGSTIGTKFPVLNADSAGYIQGIKIKDMYMAGGTFPIIYTTTPNVASLRGVDPLCYYTSPAYWMQYRTPPTVNNQYRTANRFDMPTGTDLGGNPITGIPLTNATHGGVWPGWQTAAPPASSSAPGFRGQKAFDGTYEYICVKDSPSGGADTWRRTQPSTF